MDYAAAAGTPLSAAGARIVLPVRCRGDYGKLIVVKHANGWETYYGHLAKIAKGVVKGKAVEQGQVIGQVGSTGLATGPHLHFEIRVNRRAVNPLKLMIPEGIPIHRQDLAAFHALRHRLDSYTAVTAKAKDPHQSTWLSKLPRCLFGAEGLQIGGADLSLHDPVVARRHLLYLPKLLLWSRGPERWDEGRGASRRV